MTAAILIRDGRVLIARRKAGSQQAFQWEFPGGKVEEGETPEECLKREMFEEFQIDVRVNDYLWESVYHYSHGSIRLLAFETFWESGEMRCMVHEDFRWVPADELEKYDFAPADLPFVAQLVKRNMKV